jgi:zinc transport system substrate-binding protein
MILMFNRRVALLLPLAVLGLAGCTTAAEADTRLDVVVSIYPLQYLVEQVGADLVDITTVTPAGSDPHSVELSPRQLRVFGEADAVVYLSGFQHPVDDAVTQREPRHVLDVAQVVDLRPLPPGAADEHEGEEGTDEEEHDGEAVDPHFWLDPTLLASAALPVATMLGEVDPANAETYLANAARFSTDLTGLDEEFAAGLSDCRSDTVVSSHAAFGYLTERYGLRQVSVSGIDPEGEPSPARIRDVRATIADLGVTAIFTEPLADPAVADTLAEDLGVDVGQLDPLDSHTDGPDYREVMHSNLSALRTGLVCT